jgi:hypothetical protein
MRNFILSLVLLSLFSCKKDEAGFIVEKTFGAGSAYDTEIASDSSFLVAGQSDLKPIFIKTGTGSLIDINYSPDYQGCYTEIIEFFAGYSVSNGYLLAGYSDGDILLASIDGEGTEQWDTIIAVAPDIRTTQVFRYNEDTYMLVAGDSPDSLNSSTFIAALFDINGNILQINEVNPGFNPSLTDMVILSPNDIYVSLTKKLAANNSKASVARLTAEGSIIWETELINNRDYIAGSLTIEEDGGYLYVGGRTEYTGTTGEVCNSFVASLSTGGMVDWKIYTENSNLGTDLDFDSSMNRLMLNQNCLILSGISLPDGESQQQIRVLDVCDSYDTKILGRSLSITHEDNFFIAGSKEGKFYYALKSGNID